MFRTSGVEFSGAGGRDTCEGAGRAVAMVHYRVSLIFTGQARFDAYGASFCGRGRPKTMMDFRGFGRGCVVVVVGLLCGLSRAQEPGAARPLVVGYFGQWGVYDNYFPKNVLVSGAAAQLDQMNYAQGFVTGGRCSVADPNADLNYTFTAETSVDGRADDPASSFHGDFHQVQELKRRFPKMRVLISLEGKAVDFAADAQPEVRERFVQSCVDLFLHGRISGDTVTPGMVGLFDGIDLDWEFPHEEDAVNFGALLAEFRRQMDAVRPGLRLSVAVGPSPRMYPGVDLAAVSRVVDQMGVMNYDYNGPWNPRTGFLAPLYGETGGTVERSILAYKEAGVPAAKLLLGMPFYGYGWKEVARTGENGLLQMGKSIHGDRPYSYLRTLVPAGPEVVAIAGIKAQPETTPKLPTASLPAAESAVKAEAAGVEMAKTPATFVLYRDPRSKAPWLYDGDTFWTYDDPVSIGAKASFAVEQGLGGVMAWELSEDTEDAALLRAARRGLETAPRPKQAMAVGRGSGTP